MLYGHVVYINLLYSLAVPVSEKTTSSPSDNRNGTSSTADTTKQTVDNTSEQQQTQVCCFCVCCLPLSLFIVAGTSKNRYMIIQ